MSALLESCLKKLAVSGEGILAADESTSTIGKRFEGIHLANEEKNRQAYRQLLFTTPGMEKFINGVILFEETFYQHTDQGVPFVKFLEQLGVMPGIKVDAGLVDLALSQQEKITKGLDDLSERCKTYRANGARFAKWRAVYNISQTLPSHQAISANAEMLARYAAICQEHDIVPIVEPEVLMDGSHTIERCQQVTEAVLQEVFVALDRHHVALNHIVLKPSMVISGSTCTHRADAQTVAEMTVATLTKCVPTSVRTINFLSGGQADEEATLHLDLMNKRGPFPWNLSYSYGRALQAAAIKTWDGKAANIKAAQDAFYKRAQLNSLAAKGLYEPSMEH